MPFSTQCRIDRIPIDHIAHFIDSREISSSFGDSQTSEIRTIEIIGRANKVIRDFIVFDVETGDEDIVVFKAKVRAAKEIIKDRIVDVTDESCAVSDFDFLLVDLVVFIGCRIILSLGINRHRQGRIVWNKVTTISIVGGRHNAGTKVVFNVREGVVARSAGELIPVARCGIA